MAMYARLDNRKICGTMAPHVTENTMVLVTIPNEGNELFLFSHSSNKNKHGVEFHQLTVTVVKNGW